MPDVNVKGRYRIYTHDGTEPLLFTSYSNSLCSIRRPNPNTFITISTYIPGSLSPFTTFDPGSSYTIVTRSNTADFSIGPYIRADRLPSSVRFRSPNFYHGLDKNSITVALSSYALSVNAPLSTVFTYIPNQDGFFVNSVSFNTARYLDGLPSLLTHLTPNSSYQFINRTPYTFFAPLQSEMGDTWAMGNNDDGQFGMGHLYSYNLYSYRQTSYTPTISAERIYGNWVKITEKLGSVMALSACGTKNKLFVCGENSEGELGLGHNNSVSVFTNVPHPAGSQFGWKDICPGAHSFAIDEFNEIYACGRNDYGQLGLGDSGAGTSRNVFTKVPGFTTGAREASFACTGLYHSLIRDTNGNLWSCGNNTTGQLGLGDTNQRNTFTLVQNIGNGDVGAGAYASAYISNGRMYACGNNYFSYSNPTYIYSRIGVSNSDATSIYTTFTQEANGFTDIQNLWVGGRGIFVRRSSSNVLWACGTNTWGGLGIPVSNIRSGTQYVDLDIRTLRPTVIPSNAYKFLPAIFIIPSATTRAYPYWIDNITFELKTIVLASAANGSAAQFTPFAIGTGLFVNNINDSATGSVFSSTLFHNRGPLPSPTPTQTPTVTPTPTPSPTPGVVYPQANGARIMITCTNSNAEYAYNGYGSYICLMDSDDCDNWVCRNTAFDNRTSGTRQVGLFYNFNPSPGRSVIAETLYMMWPSWGACIPTNLPGNPYKTLLVFQSFLQTSTSPSYRTGYLNIGTSVNNTISQNPAGSSAVTWTRYINPIPCLQANETPIEPRFGCSSEGLNRAGNAGFTNTDCFWDPNNSAGPRMYVVFSRLGNFENNLNGHIIDPINPIYSNNSISIIPEQTIDVLPATTPASERICRSASNGYIYCAAYLVAGGGKILRIVYYDRNKRNVYPSGWNTLPDVPNIPGVNIETPSNTDGVGYYRKAKIIRVSFFNNGDAVLCYVIPRDQISSNANFRVSNPYSDLYMQFYRKNTNSWTTPTIIKGNLIVRGIWVVSSDNNPNAWMQPSTFAPYDITVNPLTQQIHLIFNQDTGSIACNQRIYSAIFNQQGTQIGSDTEVFNPATASGQTYGFAGDIELFYKSTNANEFIPYFKAQTNATTGLYPGTPSRVNANTSVFKFNGTTYVKIFTPSVPATGGYVGFYKASGIGTTSRDSWSWSAQHKVFQ